VSKFENPNLRQALNERDESIMEMVTHTFRGRARWLMIVWFIKSLSFVAIAAISAVQFFRGDSTRWMIAWASLFIVFALGTSIMFVLYWLELNRNAVTRELKRLELQIAELSMR
jgi:hypothetical protein